MSLKLGKFANVRYYQGSMPSVPQSGGYYILIYSPNTKLAWLLIARPSIHGRVWPYRGAFNYQREGGRLRVVEGFGGLGTYKTYGDFARQMEAHEPLIHVRLDPCSECCGPLPDV